VDTLQKLHDLGGPLLLHVLTKKGKGFSPAEENQTVWHAPGLFDPETGERLHSDKGVSRYQDVFGEVLLDLARKNDKIVGITPAMASGCGMNKLAKQMPDRFFDVGIEEEHAVTFAAGLAKSGLQPVVCLYSTFMQRAMDQYIHDVMLLNLNVMFGIDRAGLVPGDGETHQGIHDIGIFANYEHTPVVCPSNYEEMIFWQKYLIENIKMV
jgi:1-deoxy-D-xylulose-5-phosphate synthase